MGDIVFYAVLILIFFLFGLASLLKPERMRRFHPWLVGFLPKKAQIWAVQLFGAVWLIFSLLILVFAIKG